MGWYGATTALEGETAAEFGVGVGDGVACLAQPAALKVTTGTMAIDLRKKPRRAWSRSMAGSFSS